MWTWCFLSSNLGAKGGKNDTLDCIQLEKKKNCKKNKAQSFYFPKRLNLDGQRWWCSNGQRHPLGKCQMCLKLICPVVHEYFSLGWGILIDVYFEKARHNKTYQFKFSDCYDDVNSFPTGFTLFCACKGLVTQLCPTLCNPMDCSPPGFPLHGISQARILEWVAFSFSRGIFLTQGLNSSLLHSLWADSLLVSDVLSLITRRKVFPVAQR